MHSDPTESQVNLHVWVALRFELTFLLVNRTRKPILINVVPKVTGSIHFSLGLVRK